MIDKKKSSGTAAAFGMQEANRHKNARLQWLEQKNERAKRQLAEIAAKMKRVVAQARILERERKEQKARAEAERCGEELRRKREKESKEAERKEEACVATRKICLKLEAEMRTELQQQVEKKAIEECTKTYLERT